MLEEEVEKMEKAVRKAEEIIKTGVNLSGEHPIRTKEYKLTRKIEDTSRLASAETLCYLRIHMGYIERSYYEKILDLFGRAHICVKGTIYENNILSRMKDIIDEEGRVHGLSEEVMDKVGITA